MEGWMDGRALLSRPSLSSLTHVPDQLQGRLLAVSLHALAASRAVPPGSEGVPIDEGKRVRLEVRRAPP